VGDSFFEYTGVPPARLKVWEEILQEVGHARGYGPGHGKPGDEEHQRISSQAIEQLWTHIALLPKQLDTTDPFVIAYLNSLENTVAVAREAGTARASLALSQVMGTLEVLLLGLIGPEGQSPVAPYAHEIPTQPYFEGWLACVAKTADLLPGPAAARTLSWRFARAVVLPPQAKELAERKAKDVTLDEIRALVEHWHRKSPSRPFIGAADDEERGRYFDWQHGFREVFRKLQSDLRRFASQGRIYLGWTAWYGYE
jgi:hypothetical protein